MRAESPPLRGIFCIWIIFQKALFQDIFLAFIPFQLIYLLILEINLHPMFRGLKSLIAGILAGTALGVLFSPKKGSEIRKNFKNEIDKGGIGWETIKDTFANMGKDFGGTCKECYDDLMENEEFQKAASSVKKQAKIAKDHAENWIKENVAEKTIKKAKKDYGKVKRKVKRAVSKTKKEVGKVKKKAKKTIPKGK